MLIDVAVVTYPPPSFLYSNRRSGGHSVLRPSPLFHLSLSLAAFVSRHCDAYASMSTAAMVEFVTDIYLSYGIPYTVPVLPAVAAAAAAAFIVRLKR